MSKKIKVALLGMGEIGQAFAEQLLERIQIHRIPVEIVAVAHHHLNSPVVLGFQQNKVATFKDAMQILEMDEKIDIIFDLTGNPTTTQALRIRLIEKKNRHTFIAPEVMAHLLWHFFDDGHLDLRKIA